jgi:DNA mismatch repair protein MutL
VSTIARLDPETVGRIAAGEVVERPAAALKELVENALDAGARRVDVRLGEGGLGLIEVVDDGSGMSPEELPLALERHATSKIRSADDLERLVTYGFRGEALPAIAAVSRLTLASRPAACEAGAQVVAEGGAVGPVVSVGMAPGTRVVVERLFANVPARRRFLKGERAEAAACHDALRRIALAAPAVAFRLHGAGSAPVWQTTGSADPARAWREVYGETAAEAPWPLGPAVARLGDGSAVSVAGLVSAPSASRASRLAQTFVVNGRVVTSAALRYALESAYQGHLARGRYPAALVEVRVAPQAVDVNVHPQKREVKFADERGVAALVHRAVLRAIEAGRGATAIGTAPDARAAIALPGRPAATLDRLAFPPLPGRFGPPVPHAPPQRVSEPAPPYAPPGAADGDEPSSLWSEAVVLRQIRRLYLLAEDAAALYLIDQHAAAERVLYERLMAPGAGPPRQVLLAPIVVETGPVAAAQAADHAAALLALGLRVEPFGDRAVLVREAPAGAADPARLVTDLLDTFATGRQADAEARHRRLALVACHSAVRAGDPLSQAEMEALLRDLGRCANPFTCPHGRPAVRRLPFGEVAAWFKRRD